MKCLRKKEVKEGKKEGGMTEKREEGERREEKRKEEKEDGIGEISLTTCTQP